MSSYPTYVFVCTSIISKFYYSFPYLSCKSTQAHTHTTQIHTPIHTQTHTHTYIYTHHTHPPTQRHTPIHTHTHTQIHTPIHTHTYIYIQTQKYTYTRAIKRFLFPVNVCVYSSLQLHYMYICPILSISSLCSVCILYVYP